MLQCYALISRVAFKSECENSTLALLQRFVGLVLLELSDLSSRAFSQSGNNFSRAVPPVMMLLKFVSEKQRTNILIAQAWHRNLRSDSVLVYQLHRYRCHIVSVPNLNKWCTMMPTWNIRHTVVVLHRFFIWLCCFSIIFLCKHRRIWLLHSHLLQRLMHETAF